MPARIQRLKVDARGYPVPWFVAWIDGKPDFRVIDTPKLPLAYHNRLCWICGEKLGANLAFVVGPMCAVNRTTAEPPSHRDCAEFSAKACPFLTLPKAVRRESNLPEHVQPAGEMITRNPGVALVYITDGYRPFSDGSGGVLFRMNQAKEVLYFAKGRTATRDEIMESINSGLPLLSAGIETGSQEEKYFNSCVADAMRLVPTQ